MMRFVRTTIFWQTLRLICYDLDVRIWIDRDLWMLEFFIVCNTLTLISIILDTVRGALGIYVILAFLKLKDTVSRVFGKNTATWFACITVSQYHFMFYLSRPLPNIMVLPLGEWMYRIVHDTFNRYSIVKFLGLTIFWSIHHHYSCRI